MKILKFGGTSVGTPESLASVRQIVSSIRGRSVIVVSALGGVTDLLLSAAAKARDGIEPYTPEYETILRRHRQVIAEIVVPAHRARVTEEVEALIGTLDRLLTGVRLLGELTKRTRDLIVSLGERMSCRIVAGMFDSATLLDSLNIVKTDSWVDNDVVATDITSQLIREAYAACPTNIAVAPGFISTDRESGRVTNLGRGGSDYTAALFAAALDAESLEIWTDVDGFMTGDPRVIPTARVIPSMSFVESMELCTYGAKVIYPPTIYPVFHKNIPIVIKNTFNPSAPGTLITDDHHASKARFRGISSISAISLVSMRVPPADDERYRRRIHNILSKNGVGVILSIVAPEGSPCVAIRSTEADKARRIMQTEFASDASEGKSGPVEITDGMTAIAIVGDSLDCNNALPETVAGLLKRSSCAPPVFARDTSSSILAFITEEGSLQKSINALHDFFLASARELNNHTNR